MQKKEDIPEFEKLEQQLHSFLAEISELSRKKPNDPLNKFKLKFINSTLQGLNQLVGDDRPFPDFESFDADDLPSNRDVVVILSQYAAAVHRFRLDNSAEDEDGDWCWIVRGKTSEFVSGNPDDFRYTPKKD
ncbi:conserved hypothetical protein [Candidatus Sulfotelmatobacter kueseliae]|uniref:Uncharacterized protein n=1 Tax=Candidatus Sulfotelmatobacter kueseliae TaxID=2042962 RepID=A0A2U3KRW2_9BACT|nr:conserved hypothetical protein [Candidatus Sulfotelmatobacter kueseliae]